MASDLTSEILAAVSSQEEPIFSKQAFPLASFHALKASLDRLASREMIVYETIEQEEVVLTEEGHGIVSKGSHEAKVFDAVRQAMDGLRISDLPDIVGKESAKVGQGKAFKEGWIKKTKDGLLLPNVESITDSSRDQLRIILQDHTHADPGVIADLRKRKLASLLKVIAFKISKGPKFALQLVKEETDLTADMLASGSWKDHTFKNYNFNSLGTSTPSGALHPLNKVRHEFRQIFFEMGFEEMPSNQFVETGFWNFDALFVPQQHPARDLQDTFYISDPLKGDRPHADLMEAGNGPTRVSGDALPRHPVNLAEYWENVRAVHESGKFGSTGYRYPWSEEESLRLVLRTHTTAISTRILYNLAANPRPARYFSIDRVFRNETVDATHLAEFHQVEGVIADFNLTLGGLIGFMETFFAKMGIRGLRFKPAYNPYTEPSMEIFSYHKGLAKWVEIGNSGMFRPEMLEPMGLPKDLRVYGWGLSLERPTMIKYGVNNIRSLLGHKVDLNFVESNPAVRLEKE
ncbi:MAG: Phenylalanyl-tRNA synthetase, beta subunit, cytoplasmic [Trizodia sp. TS-e1964]|nr:MAG: Phenylalanyl-tRNA synthetase, beta subunit, cytoplasmic [Trizodia sp. TS-e1964]